MSKEALKRLLVKGAVSYTAVILLILTAAMPAIAVMAANSVDSAAIVDGQVKTKDIRKRAVTAKKIALGAVRSAQIKDGSITNADIAAGAAISDSKISYSTKTKRLSISGDAFSPTNNLVIYNKAFGILLFGGGSSGWFSAAVSLPDGANVTGFRFNFVDNNGADMTAILVRRHVTAGGYEAAATAGPTTGASPDWRILDGTIEKPAIDNANYIYSAMIAFSTSGSNFAGGVIITYELAGP